MARRTTDFQTIRFEGGLLPPDLLRRVLDPKEKLDGMRPEDYGLPQPDSAIVQRLAAQIPWFHNCILLNRVSDDWTIEYALRGFDRLSGVAEWKIKITRQFPKELKGSLPTVAQIEAELARDKDGK